MTARNLTPGEIAEARTCLTNHLNYGSVRVHNTPWFFLQPENTAMSPDGHVYFHPEDHRADFSTNPGLMAWLIHELTHCWQSQTGQWVMLRGIYERNYRYGTLTARSSYAGFNIEQQASIVEDLYRVQHGLAARRGTATVPIYRSVIPMVTPR